MLELETLNGARTRFIASSLVLMVLIVAYFTSEEVRAAELNLAIERNMTCGDGSIMGRMLVDGLEIGKTLELPWRDNQPYVSQIPKGIYSTTIKAAGNLGWRIRLDNVNGRSEIQIHRGNFRSETEGCILLGKDLANKKCGVADSVEAMKLLEDSVLKASDAGNMSVPVTVTVEVR